MLLLAQRSSQRPSSFGCFPHTPENIYTTFAVHQRVKVFYIFQAVLQLAPEPWRAQIPALSAVQAAGFPNPRRTGFASLSKVIAASDMTRVSIKEPGSAASEVRKEL